VFSTEDKNRFVAASLDIEHGELGHEADVVLNIHLKVLITDYGCAFLDNTRKLFGGESVINVIRDPCLEAAHGFFTYRSSAVDEVFVDPCDLSDVGMRR